MLEIVCQHTNDFIQQMPKALRKKYGQFFTSIETARFMASLFDLPDKNELHILDPGAGSGILSIALLENIFKEDDAVTVHLTCYENDPNIQPLLLSNLELASQIFGSNFHYELERENYILSQSDVFNSILFTEQISKKYDLIIGNPPYMKIPKEAPEACAMKNVCYGAPNLYFLFTSMSIFNMEEDGELVYIIPRSWTSGAYFQRFREYLLHETRILHIHLFVSRDEVFKEESVLQETMIIKLKKTKTSPDEIVISTTQSSKDFQDISKFPVPYSIVVSSKKSYIYLPTDKEEVKSLSILNQFGNTLLDLGLKMKTGLIVDFRTRELLRDKEEEHAVPLIYSQHIRDGRVRFPVGKGSEYIVTDKIAFLQRNKNYLFLKRFTAKEEHRRLQCGIYLKRYLPNCTYISTQNKVNFIDGIQEISECLVYGLYVLYNSTLYDMYYRILNGSTQVNSTEMNEIPVPSLSIIEKMGKELMKTKNLSEAHCDEILNSYI